MELSALGNPRKVPLTDVHLNYRILIIDTRVNGCAFKWRTEHVLIATMNERIKKYGEREWERDWTVLYYNNQNKTNRPPCQPMSGRQRIAAVTVPLSIVPRSGCFRRYSSCHPVNTRAPQQQHASESAMRNIMSKITFAVISPKMFTWDAWGRLGWCGEEKESGNRIVPEYGRNRN